MPAAFTALIEKRNLFKEFPSELKVTLFIRIFTGQTAFFLIYFVYTLAPMTLITVIAKLEFFFVFILGYFINKEPIVIEEVFGMIICFSAVIVITVSQPNSE